MLRIGPSLKAGATSAHDVEMYYLPVQCQHLSLIHISFEQMLAVFPLARSER